MFEHNATFSSVDLTAIAIEKPHVMKRLLSEVLSLLAKVSPERKEYSKLFVFLVAIILQGSFQGCLK